jgi:hypothetical protein
MKKFVILFFFTVLAACPTETKNDAGIDAGNNQQTDSGTDAGEDAGHACTADALLCPDGTAVGRTGRDCVFDCSEHCGEELSCVNGELIDENENGCFDRCEATVIDIESELLYYWHFNSLDGTVTSVHSDYTHENFDPAEISYPGTGGGYLDERKHRVQDPVSNLNLQLEQSPDQGAVLRVRNPSDTRELILSLSTIAFQNIQLRYATTRTSNGARIQKLYTRRTNSENWTELTPELDVSELDIKVENSGWELKAFDFSEHTVMNNTADLQIRIVFLGDEAANDSGNNRFDNITVHGKAIVE